ncbi:hypothetical protein B296_00047546 [Ensete ventricosum]|uniref:Uncharacterized protein n=1 Tax=Ensete ventricosum TaxID=4639 RepID=A0A426YZ86_ENSVE|nr:hypothetical protein B296_00047546 [Ensete ventricosum]
MVERTDLPIDQYTDRPLLGSTIDYGCFCPVTARNTSIRSILTIATHYRGVSTWLQRERRKKKEKEGEPHVPMRRHPPSTLPIRRLPPSPNATDEKKPQRHRLLFSSSP